MVGGGEDEGSAGFEEFVAVAEEGVRVVEVLDDFGGDEGVDGADSGEEVGVEGFGRRRERS